MRGAVYGGRHSGDEGDSVLPGLQCYDPSKVSLFGEMVDSRIMTRTTEEIEKAEVLLLVGTTLRSETFSNYLKYFHGKYLAVLHRTPHYSDEKADLTLIGEPGQILSQLGY